MDAIAIRFTTARVRLARLLLALAERVLLRMPFSPRRSLWLDRLILWAGK